MTSASQPSLVLRGFGALGSLDAQIRTALLDRTTSIDPTVRDATAAILADVRAHGDVALRDMARRFDGVELDDLEVPRDRWKAALDDLDPSLRQAMARAVANIATVHRAFLPSAVEVSPEPGIVIGR
ncbi:MAG TPA: histidinol dehydrogenase, partial [Gemmatimonadaceae bacterium]|nr:histidinol dehydrogenase [Gemmatimonadaceae bacterium]